MKKYILTMVIIFFGSSSIVFGAGNFYVGLGRTTGSGQLNVSASSGSFSASVSQDYDSSSTPIKVGYLLKDNKRVEFSVESMKHKFGGVTDTVSGWNIDWDFLFPKDKVFPFLTVGFGYYRYEDTAQYFVDNEDLKGLAINYGGGVIYALDEKIEIEASLRFKRIQWQDVTYLGNGITLEGDSTGSALYIGANYKF